MAPHRVAGAATVSPYVYDARQERALPGQALVQSSSAAAAATSVTASASTTVNENADRGAPHGKGKKPKAKPRAERPPRQEEEMRFNTGPRNLRAPQTNRGGRRGFRIPGRTYPEDQNGIPDYPPPSFQEAMTTPPVSVCSSTTSLPLAPALPLVIPENIPEEPRESMDQPAVQAINEVSPSDNDLDFEGTMFVIDRNSVPFCSTDLPRGAALEERVKSDWLKRRGVEFPNKSSALSDASSASKPLSDGINALTRGRSAKKLLTPLLIDPEPKNDDIGPVPISPKRRFLSLSPLRTIFPPRSPIQEDRATLSAHPSPTSSPYPTSRSLFFRSSSSLATASFLRLPLLSSPHAGKREPLSRKFFKKDRGKQNSEKLEAWEVLTEETYAGVDEEGNECADHPRSLLSAVEFIRPHFNEETSPTKSVSFSLGTPYISDASTTRRPLVIPEATEEERRTLGFPLPQASQETFLRDWKGSSQLFLDRSVHRNRSPTSGIAESTHRNPMSSASDSTLSLNSGPPLVSVRVRAMSPSPPPSLVLKHAAHVAHPSPLRLGANSTHSIAEDQLAAEAAIYQRALDTPLPMTPTFYNQFDHEGSVAGFNDEDSLSDLPVPSAGTLPSLLTNPISAQNDHHHTAPGFNTAPAPATLSIATPLPIGPTTMSMPTEVVKTNSLEEPITPTRHHYAGRPLPRPPPSTTATTNTNRVHVVDSMYASSETPLIISDNPLSTCPEGLLIDLEDTTLDTIPASGATTPLSERYTSQPHLPLSHVQAQTQASSSSVDLLADPRSLNFSSSRSPLLGSRHSPGAAVRQSSASTNNVLSDLTDLDLLVSRLTDADSNGADYETLLLLSEVIGPANTDLTSTSTSNPNPNLNPNSQADSSTTATAISSSSMTSSSPNPGPHHPNGNISLIARIEVKRRRITNKGVVKLKLALLDVAVNKCGVCLFQFKDGDMGALTSVCQHSFHESCLGRWLRRSKTCPLCRVPLDTDIR